MAERKPTPDVIYKFPLIVTDVQEHVVPGLVGVQGILSVQVQRGVPCVWMVVNEDLSARTVRFRIIGTGHAMVENRGAFLGTFQLEDGHFVGHVFYEVLA